MKNKRIILDTNLWISYLISKNLNQIDSLIKSGEVKLLFSYESFEEVVDVVERPKFKQFFSTEDIEQIIDLFDQYGELVIVKSQVHICREKKDNFLLDLSIDGKADYLINGDKDLLVLKKIEKTRILSITEFLSIVK